jgi:hypothetical protein
VDICTPRTQPCAQEHAHSQWHLPLRCILPYELDAEILAAAVSSHISTARLHGGMEIRMLMDKKHNIRKTLEVGLGFRVLGFRV